MLESLWRDLRYGARNLIRRPGFTAVAVVSLALGIGLNATIFSLVNAILLRPLPVSHPDRLVTIFTSGPAGDPYSSSSYLDDRDFAAGSTTLEGVAGHSLMFAWLDQGGSTAGMVGEIVTSNYFDVLGVRLAMGRGFAPGDDRADAAPVTVLSDRLWRRAFAADPQVLGRTLTMRGHQYRIVGVAPASFTGLMPGVSAALWVPVGRIDDVEPAGAIDTVGPPTGTTWLDRRGQRWLFLVGRLAPGATVAAARAEVAAVSARLERSYPTSNRHRQATAVATAGVRLSPDIDQTISATAAVLMGAVGLVLLVACSNLATMLLSRATARSKEMALRLALGATRGQLVRQLLTESIVLATAGGAAGFLVATWAARSLAAIQPPIQVAINLAITPDVRVFLFTFALALVTSLVFGLAPALRASRPDLVPALKGETARGPKRRFGVRDLLTVGQMAVSMILLVVAGLFVRSYVAASHVDVGFDVDRLAYAAVDADKMFDSRARVQQFYQDAAKALAALPGVTSVALADRVPFSLTLNTTEIAVDGLRGPEPDGGFQVSDTDVGPNYFETMGVPILEGRAFDSRDREGTEKVAIVNQAGARKFWPGLDAIGQHFHTPSGSEYTVIGVARDHPVISVGGPPPPYFHFAIDQQKPGFSNLVVRTTGPAEAIVPAMGQALRTLDPRVAFIDMRPMSGLVGDALFPARTAMALFGGFGLLALTLALVGLYGVVAFNVARRTHDIGIRMALGAGRGRILRQVVGDALVVALAGGVAGLVAAYVAAQAVGAMLIGVTPADPLTYAAAAAVLTAAAVAASLGPARRAASVDPLVALRQL
jgi:putative ABC transport system permease protein